MNIPMIKIELNLEIGTIIVKILLDLMVAQIDKIGKDQKVAGTDYQNMKCT